MTPFRPDANHWQVLPHLTCTGLASRLPDGGLASQPGPHTDHCLAFGPHWWLKSGFYRLTFTASAAAVTASAQPVLALEIIAQNRIRACCRDFTATELAQPCTVEFFVPEEMGLEGGEESRFEFKLFRLGQATITLTQMELRRLGDARGPTTPSAWRQLGKLRKSWAARRLSDGAVTVDAISPARRLLSGGQPYLRLASGRYRLHWRGQCDAATDKPVLAIDVLGRSHWRRLRARLDALLGRLGPAERIATARIGSADVAQGELLFEVPAEMGMDQGEDAPFELRFTRLAPVALRLDDVTLEHLGPLAAHTPRARAPNARQSIVVVGNCQADIIASGFRLTESLNRRYAVKYHFVKLQDNLLDAARRDIESCDFVLAQDIADWADYPLREAIPAHVPIIRFPLLRFASLWPFDHYNGPGDKLAMEKEWPNLTFAYLDGLLGRLRQDIPDPEARFQAYASLDIPGLVNYRRLHELEARRLKAMDDGFGGGLGQFILDNFRKRQIFYTTNHPNGEVMAMLLRELARRMGADTGGISARKLDALHVGQVPVHPKVAAALGVRWATPATRYRLRGEPMRWEDYVRRYISHYG